MKYNVKVPRIHEEFSDDNNVYSTVMIIPVGISTVFIAAALIDCYAHLLPCLWSGTLLNPILLVRSSTCTVCMHMCMYTVLCIYMYMYMYMDLLSICTSTSTRTRVSIAFTMVLGHMERFSFFWVTQRCLHKYFVGIVSGNALGQFSWLFTCIPFFT